jgi:hypothetical protein
MLLACLAGLASAPLAAAQTAAPPDGDEIVQPQAVMTGEAPGAHQLLVMLRLPATHFRPDASYGGRYIDDGGRSARRRRAEALAAPARPDPGRRLADAGAWP